MHRDAEAAEREQKRCDSLGTIRVRLGFVKMLGQKAGKYDTEDSHIISSIHGKDAALQSLSHFVEFVPRLSSTHSC